MGRWTCQPPGDNIIEIDGDGISVIDEDHNSIIGIDDDGIRVELPDDNHASSI